MILNGHLLPGQKLHQADLAAQLNISRIPVREALSTLQAEGVLHYRPNTGFVVARFSGEDLSELYLMRRILETELMRTADLTTIDSAELEEIDRQLTTIPPAERPDEYQETNHRFHFRIFEGSPLALVRQEVDQLWYRTSFYRSLYLSEANVSLHVHEDHLEIIKAVRANDLDALIPRAMPTAMRPITSSARGSAGPALADRTGPASRCYRTIVRTPSTAPARVEDDLLAAAASLTAELALIEHSLVDHPWCGV